MNQVVTEPLAQCTSKGNEERTRTIDASGSIDLLRLGILSNSGMAGLDLGLVPALSSVSCGAWIETVGKPPHSRRCGLENNIESGGKPPHPGDHGSDGVCLVLVSSERSGLRDGYFSFFCLLALMSHSTWLPP